ncbi:MAG: hypothetical protein ACM3NV_11260 [Syntrophothermus sp.]
MAAEVLWSQVDPAAPFVFGAVAAALALFLLALFLAARIRLR